MTLKNPITTGNVALAFSGGNYTLQSDGATERIITLGNSPGTLTQDGGTLALVGGGDFDFQILDASGAAGTGYDTLNLINNAGFANPLGGGAFSLGFADSDTDLVLNFTAIPEPGAALPGGLGILALLRRRR